MNVLVTGDRGYIGTVLVPYLQARGHQVTGLDTDYYAACNLGEVPNGHRQISADIRDVSVEQLTGYDAVVHLAALSNDPLGDLRSEWTYEINRDASARLARNAKAAGVGRFVYASSCSLYGAAGDDALDEQAPLHPVTPYAVSKVEAERALSAMAGDGFSVTFLRNATAFGVSPRLRIDIVLNNLVGWAVTTGKIRILSDGTPWRPIIHIEDIAQATDIVLRAPRELIHNEAFNIGFDSENYQVRELGAILAKVVPGCEVEVVGQPGADPRNYRVSFAKFARRFPEFECRWTARKGAEQLYEAYTRHGLTLDTLQGRRYTRLKQLEYLLAEDRLDSTLRWH